MSWCRFGGGLFVPVLYNSCSKNLQHRPLSDAGWFLAVVLVLGESATSADLGGLVQKYSRVLTPLAASRGSAARAGRGRTAATWRRPREKRALGQRR